VGEATAGQTIGMLVGRNYGPVAARPWFVERSQGGGQLLERGSHHVDLQRALAGEVAAVEAAGGGVRLAQTGPSEADIDDIASLTLHFENGAIGTVSTAWTKDGQPELYGVDVIASDATLSLELGPQDFRRRGVAAGREVHAESVDPFNRSVQRFIDAVRSGARSRVFCTPEDALRTLIVVLSCERALAEGARVAVDPTGVP
jgi:predicted dehydrogenase